MGYVLPGTWYNVFMYRQYWQCGTYERTAPESFPRTLRLEPSPQGHHSRYIGKAYVQQYAEPINRTYEYWYIYEYVCTSAGYLLSADVSCFCEA